MLFGVATAIVSGQELRNALLQGIVEGATALLFAWLVLRYDLRTVPAFVATGLILEGVKSAAIAGTASSVGAAGTCGRGDDCAGVAGDALRHGAAANPVSVYAVLVAVATST